MAAADDALFDAAWSGDVATVEDLLEQYRKFISVAQSVNINDPTGGLGIAGVRTQRGGQTPLTAAAWGGHAGAIMALLRFNPSILRKRNEVGETALHVASAHGQADAVRVLLDAAEKLQINEAVEVVGRKGEGVGTVDTSTSVSGDIDDGVDFALMRVNDCARDTAADRAHAAGSTEVEAILEERCGLVAENVQKARLAAAAKLSTTTIGMDASGSNSDDSGDDDLPPELAHLRRR